MDERLQKALEFANYRQTLNNQLSKLKTRAEGMLIISKNGGTFTVNRELICFLKYLEDINVRDAVLLDDNNNPISITEISKFLKDITTRYLEVTNDYLCEYQQIRTSRNVKSILSIKEE